MREVERFIERGCPECGHSETIGTWRRDADICAKCRMKFCPYCYTAKATVKWVPLGCKGTGMYVGCCRPCAEREHKAERDSLRADRSKTEECAMKVRSGADQHAATELRLYADNSGDLYRQLTLPTLKNLEKQKARGVYSQALALRSFDRIVMEAAKRYAGEFCASQGDWCAVFSKPTRDQVARDMERHFCEEYELGNRHGHTKSER